MDSRETLAFIMRTIVAPPPDIAAVMHNPGRGRDLNLAFRADSSMGGAARSRARKRGANDL